jgi:hypothetical protein
VLAYCSILELAKVICSCKYLDWFLIAFATVSALLRSFAFLEFDGSSSSRSSCRLNDIRSSYPLVAKNRLIPVVSKGLAFIATLALNSQSS